MNADRVKELLLQSGMFAFIKQRPYDVIADPAVAPRAIFVSAFDSNPLAPEFEFALKGEEANFQTGLDALAKIAKTYLGISVKQKSAALTQAKNVTITAFDGPNPAGNVGVQINRVAPVVKGETVWTIDPASRHLHRTADEYGPRRYDPYSGRDRFRSSETGLHQTACRCIAHQCLRRKRNKRQRTTLHQRQRADW